MIHEREYLFLFSALSVPLWLVKKANITNNRPYGFHELFELAIVLSRIPKGDEKILERFPIIQG